MANLARFNPFRALSRFEHFPRDIDDFFKASWPSSAYALEKLGAQIPVDVPEDDKAFKVRAEIPGFSKEDLTVSVVGDQVAISAESRKEKEEKKGEQTIMRECYYGKQYRSFVLPQEVDASAAAAKYSDGVLELTLPKKSGSSRTN